MSSTPPARPEISVALSCSLLVWRCRSSVQPLVEQVASGAAGYAQPRPRPPRSASALAPQLVQANVPAPLGLAAARRPKGERSGVGQAPGVWPEAAPDQRRLEPKA